MLTQRDVKRLFSAVFYNGEYAGRADASVGGIDETWGHYVGLASYDVNNDFYLNIYVDYVKNKITIVEDRGIFDPSYELVETLKRTFPDKDIKPKSTDITEKLTVYKIIIHF